MSKKFADIVVGHTFTFVESGVNPKENKFACAFCGGLGIHWVKVRRDDGAEYLIGNTCLTKVGLSSHAKKGTIAKKKAKKVHAEETPIVETQAEATPAQVVPHKEEMPDSELDSLLDELNPNK